MHLIYIIFLYVHFNCLKVAHINAINVAVIDHPVLPFDVNILKQDVMYKDISLTMLDIPQGLPFFI